MSMHTMQNGGNMPDQKLDNLLNLAMDATEEEREKSRNLNVGRSEEHTSREIPEPECRVYSSLIYANPL